MTDLEKRVERFFDLYTENRRLFFTAQQGYTLMYLLVCAEHVEQVVRLVACASTSDELREFAHVHQASLQNCDDEPLESVAKRAFGLGPHQVLRARHAFDCAEWDLTPKEP